MKLSDLKAKISGAVAKSASLEADARVDLAFTPDSSLGDLTTNAALVYAGKAGKAPRELAVSIAAELKELEGVREVSVAGPGFINITLADGTLSALAEGAARDMPKTYKDQVIVTEYSDPNPFKVLHVGHLYTSVVGDAINGLFEVTGAKVHPVNFGGDVGLHVGRTMWGILQELGGEKPEGLKVVKEQTRPEWMAARYVAGTRAYEESEDAKREIIALNKQVYRIHEVEDHNSALAQIYWTCRQWSYDYFEAFYARIGTHFEKYYPESATAPVGLATVREQQKKGVYEESDGAVVFKGEPYGLHTRVFITSEGLPTYETKDVGVLMAKWKDYKFDQSVVITGNDIQEYMKVVLKSVEQFDPELVKRSRHITHGNVKLAGGVKMSSRMGNFLGAEAVLDAVAAASQEATGKQDWDVTLGAIKYAFLKQRIGADLVFVPEESVSLEGNSGPYLQYAHARARSILSKATAAGKLSRGLEPAERELAWKISQFPEVVARSVAELMPHHICTYLYELAQVFNRFYEGNRVVGSEREGVRLGLVSSYADVLKNGLGLLKIAAPERL